MNDTTDDPRDEAMDGTTNGGADGATGRGDGGRPPRSSGDDGRPPHGSDDEQALGAALGEAIERRAGTPAALPPVAHVADRAAARARARRRRTGVLSVAATAALLAGGLVTWNALTNDDSGSVVVLGETDGASTAVAPAAEPEGSAPSADADDHDNPAAEQAPPAPAEPPPPPEPDIVTPEDLSTGPALAWTELSGAATPLPDGNYLLNSVGDGRIVARRLDDTGAVAITDDGNTWTHVDLPPDFSPVHLDIGGSRWVVGGIDAAGTTRAALSDDEGATWTELIIDLVAAPMPPGCAELATQQVAMASGENIVLVVNSYPVPESALAGGGAAGSSPDDARRCAEAGSERTRILTSNGGAAELVAEYKAAAASGAAATSDGFVVHVVGPEERVLLTSTDGRSWRESRLAGYGHIATVPGTGGTIWYGGWVDGTYSISQSVVGVEPALVATFDGLQPGGALSAGPAGVAAIASPLVPSSFGIPTATVTKDGYELRFNEPVGGLTLWDLSADEAVSEFGLGLLQSFVEPENLRLETLDDGSTVVVFLDPETGEDLVSFSDAEVDSAMPEPSADEDPARADPPPVWVGWSADGSNWGWQSAGEAFGIDEAEGYPWVNLAVGDGFVLAQVKVVDLAGDAPATPTTRWFIATVE